VSENRTRPPENPARPKKPKPPNANATPRTRDPTHRIRGAKRLRRKRRDHEIWRQRKDPAEFLTLRQPSEKQRPRGEPTKTQSTYKKGRQSGETKVAQQSYRAERDPKKKEATNATAPPKSPHYCGGIASPPPPAAGAAGAPPGAGFVSGAGAEAGAAIGAPTDAGPG
jgi:hypothetical protein